jgi:hypothetical protein
MPQINQLDEDESDDEIKTRAESAVRDLDSRIYKKSTDLIDRTLSKGLENGSVKIGRSWTGSSTSTKIVKAILSELSHPNPNLRYIQALCSHQGFLGKALNPGTTIAGVDLTKPLDQDKIMRMKNQIFGPERSKSAERVSGSYSTPLSPSSVPRVARSFTGKRAGR